MKRLLIILALSAMLSSCGRPEAQIITPADAIADGEWICFRRDFTLLSPSDIELRIAADTKYWLWVNGELVVREGGLKRGPNPTDSYCDVLTDVGGFRRGRNTVALLVQYYGKSSFSHRASATPGLWFDLETTLDRVVSDDRWIAERYDAIYVPEDENPKGQRQYRLAGANMGLDARKAFDFADPKYDDRSWARAVVVGRDKSGWGELHDRPIPMWRWSGLCDYTDVRREGNLLIGRLPYNMQVTPYIRLRAEAGKRIDIYTDDYEIGKARQFHAEYITKEGEQEFEVPIWINGHDVRYELPDEGVEVLDIKWRESGYDSDFAGSFRCSDEFFNTLWRKAQRTLYITMRDNYMDCPDRERAQWWGDAVVELGEAGYVFDSRAHLLTRKAVRELMGWQRPTGEIFSPIPGWYAQELPCQMLASVGYYGFWTYYMLTGDAQTIEDVYDGVHRYIYDVWETDGYAMVRTRRGGWYWGDWGTNIDKEALQNCWYALALKGVEKMSELTDRPTEAMYARQLQEVMTAMFNDRFWTGTHYATKSYKDEPDDRVQAMAVLAGFVPQERYPTMREFFRRHYNASPYMEKYVLEALCLMGCYDDALERMKMRFHDMVVSEEYTTLWEGWEYTGGAGMKYKSGNGTYNHAWSGGGLTILSQYIAGIAPLAPRFERFSVCPNLASLEWVETSVPTVFGDIAMTARRSGDELRITLAVPAGTTAEVRLPQGYAVLECGSERGEKLVLTAGNHEVKAVKQ